MKPHIIYLDARNLYGYSQKNPLPHSNFKFVDKKSELYDQMKQSLLNQEIPEMQNPKTNFFVAVDIAVLKEGRENTQDFPFAPNSREVNWGELSFLQKQQYLKSCKNKRSPKSLPHRKLIADFTTKKKYVVLANHLKFMVDEGNMKIVGIHDILLFDEEDYLHDWVNFCTEQRNLGK
jgi:hypothetical protein